MQRLTFSRPKSEEDRATSIDVYSLGAYGHTIKIVNAVGSRSAADSVAAMIRSGNRIRAVDLDNTMNFETDGKYRTWIHCLGYDSWQMLAMSLDDMLMPQINADHLWRVLRSSKFTTPVLKSWVEPILKECLSRRFISALSGFGTATHAGICRCEDVHMDDVVSSLVSKGTIKIERSVA